MPASLPIPDVVPQLWVVLFAGPSPDEATLERSVARWLDRHLQGSFGRLVARFVDAFVRFELVDATEVPLPPLDMLRYLGLGAEEDALLRRASSAMVVSGTDVPLAPRPGMWATLWNLFFVPTPYVLGILAVVILPGLADPEMAIFEVAGKLLPAAVTGLVMAAIMVLISDFFLTKLFYLIG